MNAAKTCRWLMHAQNLFVFSIVFFGEEVQTLSRQAQVRCGASETTLRLPVIAINMPLPLLMKHVLG